jgi:hypothetical protein
MRPATKVLTTASAHGDVLAVGASVLSGLRKQVVHEFGPDIRPRVGVVPTRRSKLLRLQN